jgi:hypothetical protein
MELIPSERAVLKQIRDLFREASMRTYQLTVLASRWPPTHYDAYRTGYSGLVDKGIIEKSDDEQWFSITSTGMEVIGQT